MFFGPDKVISGEITDDNWLEIYERRLCGSGDSVRTRGGKVIKDNVPFSIK